MIDLINNSPNLRATVLNSAVSFPLFAFYSNDGIRAPFLVVRGFFERPLANMHTVWWKMLDAISISSRSKLRLTNTQTHLKAASVIMISSNMRSD